jgi:hypothetical protein
MAALLPDGSLNVSLLSKEVADNLDEDEKYHAVDEMKKRAIHMSKDYDEFKNFVACAQVREERRNCVALRLFFYLT